MRAQAGFECLTDRCTGTCSKCKPGQFKGQQGTAACENCTRNSYNPVPGGDSARSCVPCPVNSGTGPEFSSTGSAEGQTNISACVCRDDHYALLYAETLECVKCPQAARCEQDQTCIFRDGLKGLGTRCGSQLVGDWVPNVVTGKFELKGCPEGHELQAPGEERQKCHPCTDEQYILNPNEDECQPCPVGATCFGNSTIHSKVEGADWSIQEREVDGQNVSMFVLNSCPRGHELNNKRGNGDFSPQDQECRACAVSSECVCPFAVWGAVAAWASAF